jgi:N-acyl homoserine lactone hydrolase
VKGPSVSTENHGAVWLIDAVQVGELRGIPSSTLFFGDRSGRTFDIPLTMFVISNGKTTVVVDTGGGTDAEDVTRQHQRQYICTPEMHPKQRLVELGVDPASVSLVINTHLHWDHASNNSLFPNAEVVVQRAELEYAVHPCRGHRGTYALFPGRQPPWLEGLDRLRVLDGSAELLPGLQAVPLPGHTPGSQGVVVDTADGTYVITGDCAYRYENVDEQSGALPSNHFVNLIDFYNSIAKIFAAGWMPLPSHDERVVAARSFGRGSSTGSEGGPPGTSAVP